MKRGPMPEQPTSSQPDASASPVHEEYFRTSLEHLLAELGRIQLLVRAQVSRVRKSQAFDDQFQGLVVSEAEIDELMERSPDALRFAVTPEPPGWKDLQCALDSLGATISARQSESVRRGVELRLAEVARIFGLSSFEIECLLICLAPEIHPRYERLYAYLQDDVTKKRPTVDLVLNLLCASPEEKLGRRRHFISGAPLIDARLLYVFDESPHQTATLLNSFLRVDARIVDYLLRFDDIDSHLLPHVRCVKPALGLDDLILPAQMKERLEQVARHSQSEQTIFYFQGPYGSGRKAAAEALCRELRRGLLIVNAESLLAAQNDFPFETGLRMASREALLRHDAVYLDGIDCLLAEDKKMQRDALLRATGHFGDLAFLAGEKSWEGSCELQESAFIRVEFQRPSFSDRVHLWNAACSGQLPSEAEIASLANKFRFTGGQINDAARTARNLARWRDPACNKIGIADLYEGCRIHSSRKLSTLGRKIKPHHSWTDIVLAEDRLLQLQEICNSMKYRSLVFDHWGFDRKMSLGKGLNILFAGPSGTGKTMAAEIMAGELSLDLYKIDLSTVVSKYIGETEKNLGRIFTEAENSNAMLFFDEADALFGKRSEVRDSHDRYANIEVNYLLQKMEEHEGVVILATNFRKNMDDAFVRRMHFTVEFSFPDQSERRRIWEQIWPKETPQSSDLDFDFMARRYEIPGGNIRNIAMAAAFLAASDGGVVNMTHLLHGTRREYQKMGKVVRQGEFQ